MARVQTRPESKVFQFRKRVPADVLALVGGPREVKASLRTRDEDEAKRVFRDVEARHEARWNQIRLGVQHLDDRQVAAVAGGFYRDLMERFPLRHPLAMHHWGWRRVACEQFDAEWARKVGSQDDYVDALQRLHGEALNDYTDRQGTSYTGDTWGRLLAAVHRALKLGIDRMMRESDGDWSPDANLATFPDPEVVAASDPRQQFDAVWKMWVDEAKPSAGTVRRWRPALERMLAHVKTRDCSRITEKALQAWINELIGEGLNNNTVARVHLAAAKRLLSFAKQKRVIDLDPTTDIKVSNGTKYEMAMRGYEPHEAEIVLRATLVPPSPGTSPAFAAARRWVPWICAYSGARVNEITQARACDIVHASGAVLLRITKEAGTVKTVDRTVPLHQDLTDQGLLDFVRSKSGQEPLFYAPRPEGDGITPAYEEMGKRLSKWVRRLGLTDLHLDPNHAWRHAFKTLAGDLDIQERVVDAIQGHAPSTQGRRYGKVSTKQMVAAIRSIPALETSPCHGKAK